MSEIRFLRRIIYAFLLHSVFGKNATLESENKQNIMHSQKLSMIKIDDCISKIRTITGINSNFRNNIDRLAQIVQYDAIDRILRDKTLPYDQYEMLRKSYNKVLNKFANSNLKKNIAQFLNTLTPNDNNKLKAYGMISEEDKLITFINEKMATTNYTDADRREIEQYLKNLFMSLKLD